jgi:soluble lytic murein transglycosylase-like protein
MTRRVAIVALVFAAVAPAARADYAVLRSGQRLHITGYEVRGDTVRLQIQGGIVEIPASELVRVEPEEVFATATPLRAPEVPYAAEIRAAAQKYTMDEDLIVAVIAAESNFNPRAVSLRNARGLMQLLPETALRLGVKNIFDAAENIDAGTHYLKQLLARYHNDLSLTLAAYNAGPERVEQFGGVPPYNETRSYIRRVNKGLQARKSRATAMQAAINKSASKH